MADALTPVVILNVLSEVLPDVATVDSLVVSAVAEQASPLATSLTFVVLAAMSPVPALLVRVSVVATALEMLAGAKAHVPPSISMASLAPRLPAAPGVANVRVAAIGVPEVSACLIVPPFNANEVVPT